MQLEFGFLLGPPDGRYLVRPAADALVESVLVLSTLGAPQRARLGAPAAALGRDRGARAGAHIPGHDRLGQPALITRRLAG